MAVNVLEVCGYVEILPHASLWAGSQGGVVVVLSNEAHGGGPAAECVFLLVQAERWGARLFTEDVESLDLSQRPFVINSSDRTVS